MAAEQAAAEDARPAVRDLPIEEIDRRDLAKKELGAGKPWRFSGTARGTIPQRAIVIADWAADVLGNAVHLWELAIDPMQGRVRNDKKVVPVVAPTAEETAAFENALHRVEQACGRGHDRLLEGRGQMTLADGLLVGTGDVVPKVEAGDIRAPASLACYGRRPSPACRDRQLSVRASGRHSR